MRREETTGRRRFAAWLGAIVFLALAVRVGYVAVAKSGPCPAVLGTTVIAQVPSQCMGENGAVNDQSWYSTTADAMAHGHFFESGAPAQPIADHPPLQVFVLAGVSLAFEHPPLSWLSESPRTVFGTRLETHVREQRYAMAILGSLVVLLVGLLGRRIGGERLGLVAALVAALYPNMWVTDGLLFAETVARLCVLGALLLALRARTGARARSVFAFGVLCGLAALARQELLLLFPLLLLPIAWGVRRAGARAVATVLGAATAGAVLVLGPWIGFNLARFDEPVFISTNAGVTLAGANCDPGYSGHSIGLWTALPCVFSAEKAATFQDQSQLDHAYRTRALDYIEHHERRLPAVVGARVGRTWSVFRPVDMISYEMGENRERAVSWAGLLVYYPIVIAAVAGVVILLRRRRRFDLWALLVPCVVATLAAAAASGSVRNRAVAEPSLVIFAAVAVDAFLRARVDTRQP